MFHFDARYVLLIALNMIKLGTNRPWEWDPFDMFGNLTWVKFSLVAILLLFFASTSVRLQHRQVSLQCRDMSVTFTVSFVALILLPHVLFWYVYPLIPLFSWLSPPVSKLMNNFLDWLKDVLATFPDVRIHITAHVNAEPVVDEAADQV
ncbi:hypothetical protein E3N88_28343 [Mikania micrantha]|uniref:Uncharacterized protein n=1 Tax=Mikania micrantha TaxID=192012 RepID=A0A5N6N274_9ASTR|nr:hypothetical protein E3N88_28343 [Mikania micrantha]